MNNSFRKSLLIVMISAFAFSLSAQKEGLNYISKENLKSYMTFFASDEMQGREAGTLANDAAALYISTNLMRLGLRGIDGSDDYFQEIPMQRMKSVNSIKTGNYTTDSVLMFMPPAQDMETTTGVVFAGFGHVNDKEGYNDIKNIDMKGKIVIVMTGSPDNAKSPDRRNAVFSNDLDQKLGRIFMMGGPKAILLVYNGESIFSDPYASGLAEMIGTGGSVTLEGGKTSPGMPIQLGFIKTHTANMLLKPSGHTVASLTDKIVSSGQPFSFEVQGPPPTLSTRIVRDSFKSRNVIGIVEGTDPVLKNECIVYTAHFDHTGVSGGKINNGADDDASGSMALLEAAGAFMQLKKKPLRSIVFVWVNAEEKGLLGSRYYTENPVYPLDKTLLDINLDMVGRTRMASDTGKIFGAPLSVTGPGELEFYSKHESTELDAAIKESASKAGINLIDKGGDLEFGGSDHMSFWSKGVPAIMLHSGIHADLHTHRDDVEKIDFDKMERSAKMCFLLGYKLANAKERFKIDKK